MVSNILIFVFHIFLSFQFCPSNAQDLIRAGYYNCYGYELNPVSDINSSLFTHLISGFAGINSTTYRLSFPYSHQKCFSIFTDTVKQNNPSVTTLLSIRSLDETDYSTFASMLSNSVYRKFFIDSSIEEARFYGFQGLDFYWANTDNMNSSDMSNMGILFEEWRASIKSEATNSSQSELILIAAVDYSPLISSGSTYPIDSIQKYLNWVNVRASGYKYPRSDTFTGGSAVLYDPNSVNNANQGIRKWINEGLSANKLVLSLPFYGYEWKLVNPEDSGIGAPAAGSANDTTDGFLSYKDIKNKIERYGPDVQVMYNATYVVNYCTIGATWIGFDDVEAVRAKVSYAKEKGLLGYVVFTVSYDYNSVLSEAAATEGDIKNKTQDQGNNINKNGQKKRRLPVILLSTTTAMLFFFWKYF